MIYIEFLLDSFMSLLCSHDKPSKDISLAIYSDIYTTIKEYDGLTVNTRIIFLNKLKDMKKNI